MSVFWEVILAAVCFIWGGQALLMVGWYCKSQVYPWAALRVCRWCRLLQRKAP